MRKTIVPFCLIFDYVDEVSQIKLNYLFVFVKKEKEQHQEDCQNSCSTAQGGSKELVCPVR